MRVDFKDKSVFTSLALSVVQCEPMQCVLLPPLFNNMGHVVEL